MPLIQQGEAIEYNGRIWRRYIFDNLEKDDHYMTQNINTPNKTTGCEEETNNATKTKEDHYQTR